MERSFGLVLTLIRYCFVFSLRLVTRILLVSSASCGISFIVTGRCDYFGFDFTILIRKLLYVVRVPGGGGNPVRIFLFFLTTISVGRHNNIQCNELIRNLRRNIFLGALTV